MSSMRHEAFTAYSNLSDEARAAIAKFAAEHGRTWKSKLRLMWMNGKDEQHEDGWALRRLRNTVGPSGLEYIKP